METERLILRELTHPLFLEACALSENDQLAFFGLDDPRQLKQLIDRTRWRFSLDRIGIKRWQLLLKNTGETIGDCGFHNWYPDHRRAEIGYFTGNRFRRAGYMHEAAELIIGEGFRNMNLNRIEAFISPGNEPSRALIRKLGFHQEGHLRSHYQSDGMIHDSEVYGLLLQDYFNRLELIEHNR